MAIQQTEKYAWLEYPYSRIMYFSEMINCPQMLHMWLSSVALFWKIFFSHSSVNYTQVRERMTIAMAHLHLHCLRRKEFFTSLLFVVAVIIIECNKFDSKYWNYFNKTKWCDLSVDVYNRPGLLSCLCGRRQLLHYYSLL